MKLKKNAMCALLIAVILCTGLGLQSINAVASTRTVGVHVGDSEEYSAFAQGNQTGFNASNIPTSVRFTVTGINGTNVTCENHLTFSNSTQKTEGGNVNVGTGSGNMTGVIIAANLNASDLVYNRTWLIIFPVTGIPSINETIYRNYLGKNLEVNHLNLTSRLTSSHLNETVSINFFWFRSSGLLAESIFNITSIQGSITQWTFEHLTITYTIPEFPVNLILPLFMFFSTIVVVTARKKLFKPTQ